MAFALLSNDWFHTSRARAYFSVKGLLPLRGASFFIEKLPSWPWGSHLHSKSPRPLYFPRQRTPAPVWSVDFNNDDT